MKDHRQMAKLREAFSTATGPDCRIYSGIALICGFILAIGLCFVIKPKFEYHGNLDITSWISVNKYPKQQELYYYIGTLILIPAISAISWLSWVFCSYLVSMLTGLPIARTLKKYAFNYLPFIIVLRDLEMPTYFITLNIPIIMFIMAKITLIAYDLLQTRFIRLKQAIFFQDSSNLHWSVLVSGISIGFFALIEYGENRISILPYLRLILYISLLIWLFWLFYAKILSIMIKRPFKNIAAGDAYSYYPLAILLMVSFFPANKSLFLILAMALIMLMKILAIIKPEWVEKPQIHKYMLEYAIIPALIFVFFYNGGNIHGNIDLFHEGERLAPLNSLLRAKIPFRDIYLQHGLFHNAYRPLIASKLFGPTLAADRMLGSIFEPLRLIAIYILGLQVFRKRFFALLPLWIMSSGKTFESVYKALSAREMFGFISLAILSSYIISNSPSNSPFSNNPLNSPFSKGGGGDLKSPRFLSSLSNQALPFLAGIFAMLNVFYTLEMGLYALATGFLFLLIYSTAHQKKPFTPLLSYIFGAFIAFLPFALYFLAHGAFDDLIRNCYIQTRYHIKIWGLRFPPLLPGLFKVKTLETLKAFILSDAFEWYFPIIIYIITLTYLIFRVFKGRFWSTKSNGIILLLVISGIIFFRTPLGRSDRSHLYGISFAWLICTYFVMNLSEKIWQALTPLNKGGQGGSISSALCRLLVIITILCYVIVFYKPGEMFKGRILNLTNIRNIERNVVPPLDRAGGIKISPDQASQIKAVVDYIQKNTSSDETIFDFSNQGGYYFLADRPSATRYIQICYASTKAMQEEVIADLERQKTRLIIYSTGSGYDNIDGVSNVARHPLIAEYLKQNYEESIKIGNTIILQPRFAR